MGRTTRKRSRRRRNESYSVEIDQKTLNLRKWLVENGWTNETKLTLKCFPITGRGVTSKLVITPGSNLISVPLKIMITYENVHQYFSRQLQCLPVKMSMHELLTVFLMYHSTCDDSFYASYIKSLPKDIPLLPWLGPEDELQFLPKHLKDTCLERLENFMGSLTRVRAFLNKYDPSLWTEESFKWAYVMVNTRSVYIDPDIFALESYDNILVDEPCMALCPFLDMFNHSCQANTEAECVKQKNDWFYQLKILTKHLRYKQIFISYGYHDNEKLLLEYGFFIKGNTVDTVKFEWNEVLKILGVNIDRYKFKFIQNHNLLVDLFIGQSDLSFNLKALLFVINSEDTNKFSATIFSTEYSERFENIFKESAVILLQHKIRKHEEELKSYIANVCSNSCYRTLMENYLRFRLGFLSELTMYYCAS